MDSGPRGTRTGRRLKPRYDEIVSKLMITGPKP